MNNVQCGLLSIGEVIANLEDDNCEFKDSSRIILAKWLRELIDSREALYKCQVAIADTKKVNEGRNGL